MFNALQDLLDKTRSVDFLAPLALRIFLFFPFFAAGMNKLNAFEGTANWFGNPEWGLGLPAPELMAFLATAAELGGAFLLLLGLATRWATIPLMITMLVAAFAVHWENGWFFVADPAMCVFNCEDIQQAAIRQEKAVSILKEYGNYAWLREYGPFYVLNKGIETATTYFIMLLALFFTGGGRYVSIDYYIARANGRAR